LLRCVSDAPEKGRHCEKRGDKSIPAKSPLSGGNAVKTKRTEVEVGSAALPAQQMLWLELMQFYISEAWLLDERKFKDWLDLFTDDVLYFMPRRKNVPRRESHRELTALGDLAILEEDKRYLEMRVARLDTGMAWAEDPPSRTRHLIGNLVAAPLENGTVEARTAFLVYRSHLETDRQLLSGCREDLLRKVEGAWKIARRTIVLDANVLLDKNLSIFL
jgi:3-phenylpropionate/cinnamic acid dioxygenase small subunit